LAQRVVAEGLFDWPPDEPGSSRRSARSAAWSRSPRMRTARSAAPWTSPRPGCPPGARCGP